MTSEVMQGSHFKDIDRNDRKKGNMVDYLLLLTQIIQQKLLISQN